MAKRKNNGMNPAAKALILVAIVGIPALFVLAIMGTDVLLERAPYLMLVLLAIVAAGYNGMTCRLLYEYYESSSPIYSWVPCVGELALMDSSFLVPGVIAYAVALISLGISRLPYSVVGALGDVGINLPFYATVVFFIAMLAVEIIKGLGILGCVKVIANEWEEKMHGTLGSIKLFAWLGFIPFVRVMAIYGLNKPLSTLVTFNSMTVSDSDDVELEEESEED